MASDAMPVVTRPAGAVEAPVAARDTRRQRPVVHAGKWAQEQAVQELVDDVPLGAEKPDLYVFKFVSVHRRERPSEQLEGSVIPILDGEAQGPFEVVIRRGNGLAPCVVSTGRRFVYDVQAGHGDAVRRGGAPDETGEVAPLVGYARSEAIGEDFRTVDLHHLVVRWA